MTRPADVSSISRGTFRGPRSSTWTRTFLTCPSRERAAIRCRAPNDSPKPRSRAGIGSGVFVVAYGQMGGAERLWWLLRHFGHDDCAVLQSRGPLARRGESDRQDPGPDPGRGQCPVHAGQCRAGRASGRPRDRRLLRVGGDFVRHPPGAGAGRTPRRQALPGLVERVGVSRPRFRPRGRLTAVSLPPLPAPGGTGASRLGSSARPA